MKLPTLPNELIEIIAYHSDIDARLALKIKPRKLNKTMLQQFDTLYKRKYQNISKYEHSLLIDNWWLNNDIVFTITLIICENNYSFMFYKNKNLINKSIQENQIILNYYPRTRSYVYHLHNWNKPEIIKEYSPIAWTIENTPENRALFSL
jgi:6-pyruvoyl-tetrahydropterin synthase